MKNLDKYVIFSITILLIYTVIERSLTAITGVGADTLTTCFYACFGGEILTCGLIKIFKLKEANHEPANDDVINSISINDLDNPSDQESDKP